MEILWSNSNIFLERKTGVIERPRSVNPGKAIVMAGAYAPGNGRLRCHRSFYYLMHDVVGEFACAVRMRRNN